MCTKYKKIVVFLHAIVSTVAVSGILRFLSNDNDIFNYGLWPWGFLCLIYYFFNKFLLLEKKFFYFNTRFLCTMLFTFLQMVGMLWSNPNLDSEARLGEMGLWVLGGTFIAYCVENFVITKMPHVTRCLGSQSIGYEVSKSAKWKVFLIIMFGFSIPFITYFPAIVAYDSINQLTQITSNTYTTHHPLIHTLFLALCMKIGEVFPIIKNADMTGLMIHSLFQMMVVAGGFTLVYTYMREKGVNKILCYVFVLAVAFFPTHGMLAISITKDTIYGVLAMVFSIFVYELVSSKGKSSINKKWCVKYGLITILLLLFRNNSIYAWLLLFAVSLIVFWKNEYRRKITCVHVFSLIGFFVINTGLIWASGATSNTYAREMLSVPAQQIARVVTYHYDELEEEDKILISEVWGEELPEYYPAIADRSKKAIVNDADVLSSFGELWIKMGIRYPGTYLRSFMLKNKGLWYLGDTSYLYEIYSYDTGYLQITNPGNQLETVKALMPGYERHSRLQVLQSLYRHFIAYNDWQKIPMLGLIMHPAFYAWLVFGFLVVCINLKKWEMMLPVIYSVGVIVTLLLGPCILVRYVYPIMISIVILTFLSLREC